MGSWLSSARLEYPVPKPSRAMRAPGAFRAREGAAAELRDADVQVHAQGGAAAGVPADRPTQRLTQHGRAQVVDQTAERTSRHGALRAFLQPQTPLDVGGHDRLEAAPGTVSGARMPAGQVGVTQQAVQEVRGHTTVAHGVFKPLRDQLEQVVGALPPDPVEQIREVVQDEDHHGSGLGGSRRAQLFQQGRPLPPVGQPGRRTVQRLRFQLPLRQITGGHVRERHDCPHLLPTFEQRNGVQRHAAVRPDSQFGEDSLLIRQPCGKGTATTAMLPARTVGPYAHDRGGGPR